MVITGAGVVSPVGIGAEAFWDALAAGRSGAARVEIESVGAINAFPVEDLDAARERFGHREVRRMSRSGRMAALAGALALDDAGPLGLGPERVGVAIGCVHGGAEAVLEAHRALAERGPGRISPLSVPLSLANAPAAATARVLELRGPAAAPSTACAAGSDAIGQAVSLIREGRADAMLAGGADAPLSPVVVAGYQQVGALSRGDRPPGEASRPFDLARDGFLLGEGAGVLLLEEREHALARGARIHAELAGYGSSCDAGHLTDPDATGGGQAQAVWQALADAGVEPGQVDYVNAHATSTPAGDLAEARAIVRAGLAGAAVSSTKSAHGHALGGAGGVEAVATLIAFARGLLPATLNLDDPDPELPLRHVREARAAEVDVAVSHSFGFGGHNACLVLTRHQDGLTAG